MSEERAIIGDWMGTLYSMGGRRWDWILSLGAGGSYRRTLTFAPDDPAFDSGTWIYHQESDTLDLIPHGAEVEKSTWWVLDVTKCERVNTLLVLRACVLASRLLPIVLYRVHNKPHGK